MRENLEKSKFFFSLNFEFFGLKHIQLGIVSQFNTPDFEKNASEPHLRFVETAKIAKNTENWIFFSF